MKSKAFPDPLIMVCIEPYLWSVFADFQYWSAFARIVVPAEFTTDLASIPRILQWLPHLHPNGRCRRAAVIHDFLYSRQSSCSNRAWADEVFRRALIDEGLSERTAKAYYYAVRWFAGGNWKKR